MNNAEYDYIIVGAGCVLANRLTRDPKTRVLLLEAGTEDSNMWIKVPAAVPRVVSHPKLTWGYTSEQEPGLHNRKISWPRGKTLGGSSSINGHVYMRGTPDDYNGWRDLGNQGWGWDDVLPYFKRSERHYLGASEFHGGQGELDVSPLLEPHPASASFVEAAVNAGVPRNNDFNGPKQEGVGYLQFLIRNGIRASKGSGLSACLMRQAEEARKPAARKSSFLAARSIHLRY